MTTKARRRIARKVRHIAKKYCFCLLYHDLREWEESGKCPAGGTCYFADSEDGQLTRCEGYLVYELKSRKREYPKGR